MIATAEQPGDRRIAQIGEFAEHVHGDLAGGDQRALTAATLEVLDRKLQDLGDVGEQLVIGAGLGLAVDEQIGELGLGEVGGDRHLVQTREGSHPDQGAFEFADVGGDVGGDEFECFVGYEDPVAFRLVAKDCQTCFEIRRLDVGDEAPLEAPAQAFFECGDGVGHTVGGDDDLLVGAVERVERVEEFLLESFLAGDELDVVDEQHVDVAITASKRVRGVLADRVDVFVHERLGGHVAHHVVLIVRVDVVADGVEQVCLAEACRAVDEQRVVAASRRFGDAQCSCERELVGRAFHEGLEGVARVQAGFVEHQRLLGGVAVRCGDRRPGRLAACAVGRPGTGRIMIEHQIHRGGAGSAVGGLDVDFDSAVALVHILEGLGDQREVATHDAVAHVGTRGEQPERVVVGWQRGDVLERGEPDRFSELGSKRHRHLRPHVCAVRHLSLPIVVDSGPHRCPQDVDMSVDDCGTANLARVSARQNLTSEVLTTQKYDRYPGVMSGTRCCGQLTSMWFDRGGWRKCTGASSLARSVRSTRTTIVVVVDGT